MNDDLTVTYRGTSGDGVTHHFKVRDSREYTVKIDSLRGFRADDMFVVEAWRNNGWVRVASYGENDGVQPTDSTETLIRRCWNQVMA